MVNIFRNAYIFFREGLRNMTVGRTLWAIVIIKLIIMFAILKPVFFPNFLNRTYGSDEERADHVRRELITKP